MPTQFQIVCECHQKNAEIIVQNLLMKVNITFIDENQLK